MTVLVYHLREWGACEICGNISDHYHGLITRFDLVRGYLFCISEPYRAIGRTRGGE